MRKIIAVLFILCLLATSGCAKKTDEPTQSAEPNETAVDTSGIEQTASGLASDIVKSNYENAAENYKYSAEMKKVISPGFYENDIGSLQTGFGEFTEMKKPVIAKKDGYIIVSIPMVFTKKKVNYNIVFNRQNEIAGFNIGEYKESEETGAESDGASVLDIARGYAAALMAGNYDKAYTEYPHDAAMAGAVNAEAYKDMIESIKAQNGDFVKLGEAYSFKASIYTAVDVPVEMSGESFNLEIYFDADNKIAGVKFVPYGEKTETKMPDNIIERELTAEVNGHNIGGTLTLPKNGGSFPVVVLVHGSGPNDRDETIFSNKPFRDIAWGLASRGIAVYRYDKRNYAYNDEFKTGYDLTIYDETVDDAAEIAKMLQGVEGLDPSSIYILGHSLGGYAMPRIAQETKDSAGYIIMAGSARAPHELIPEQYEYLFGLDGVLDVDEKAVLEAVAEDAEKIEHIADFEKTDIFMGMYKAYIEDLLSYDPIETAEFIEKPVLVLQGERDYQVTLTDFNMWYGAFGERANWTFITYSTLNHLMMAGEGPPNNAEYSVAGNVDENLINDIADFIKP